MAEGPLGISAYQAPALALGWFNHFDFVTRRKDVGNVGLQRDLLVSPTDRLVIKFDANVGRNVVDIAVTFIDAVTFGLKIHEVAITFDHIFELVVHVTFEFAKRESLSEVGAGVGDGTTGVFLFSVAQQVGGIADLGFDLLLAVAVVVVGDQRDNHAVGIPAGDLECGAVVVEFVLGLPTHAVLLLTIGGIRDVGQAEVFLFKLSELGCKNDTSGVAGPMFGIETGVVFGKIRVATVAKDAFDEVEVGNEVSGGKKPDLHAALLGNTGDFWANDRAEKQGNKNFRRVLAGSGKGQDHDVLGRVEGRVEQARKRGQRNGFFIRRHRKSTFSDVEYTLGRASVGGGIVANTLMHTVGTQDRGFKFVLIGGKREHTANTVTLEHKRSSRDQSGGGGIAQGCGEIVMNRLIDRAKMVGEQTGLFLERSEQGAPQIEKREIFFFPDNVVSTGRQLQIYKLSEADFFLWRGDGWAVIGESDTVFELLHKCVRIDEKQGAVDHLDEVHDKGKCLRMFFHTS